MILDATAAYRSMYKNKQCSSIIYIDVERALLTKPTIFCDNTKTPFEDATFDSIFYDPPHGFGEKQFDHLNQMSGDVAAAAKHLPFVSTYYGWDKYSNQQSLIVHVFKAQREFHRILKNDGLLWFKWCEVKISLHRVLLLFEDWDVLMHINVADPTKTWGKSKSYWIVLTKKKKNVMQTRLS